MPFFCLTIKNIPELAMEIFYLFLAVLLHIRLTAAAGLPIAETTDSQGNTVQKWVRWLGNSAHQVKSVITSKIAFPYAGYKHISSKVPSKESPFGSCPSCAACLAQSEETFLKNYDTSKRSFAKLMSNDDLDRSNVPPDLTLLLPILYKISLYNELDAEERESLILEANRRLKGMASPRNRPSPANRQQVACIVYDDRKQIWPTVNGTCSGNYVCTAPINNSNKQPETQLISHDYVNCQA